jgi:hypothetical protein
VYNTEYPFVTTEPKSSKKLNKISRYAIKHFRSKAKPTDFRLMFHREPAGIRSQSSEPAAIRSRRLELKSYPDSVQDNKHGHEHAGQTE